jgi:DNA repair protein RadC
MKNIRTEQAPNYSAFLAPETGFGLFTIDELALFKQVSDIIEFKYLRESDCLKSPDLTKQFLCARLAERQSELFGVIWLDTRHRTIAIVDMFFGTIDGAAVYPREVVKSALQHNASACIFFHNHPSGNPEPSQADLALTKRLKDALAHIDVRVLDHIVVGGTQTASLAERGLM